MKTIHIIVIFLCYPIVLFLHGAGERGTDNDIQLAVMPGQLVSAAGQSKYPCFILAPQCPKNDVWVNFPQFPEVLQAPDTPTTAMRMVIEVMVKLEKELPVDKHRVYLTGYSMGGEGSFDLLIRRPDWFAAAIPICSVSDTSKAGRISKIPIWAFHCDQDNVNDVKYSRLMINALKSHGGNPKYTEYPGVKHNSWGMAYKEPALYDWLFLQRRQ
jgi:predicted peptidase